MSAAERPPGPPQAPATIPGPRIGLISLATLALVIALSAIGWVLAGPTTSVPAIDAEPLVLPHQVFDTVAPPRAPRAERWGWVNRDAGIVHMPLSVAAEAYLEQQRKEGAP